MCRLKDILGTCGLIDIAGFISMVVVLLIGVAFTVLIITDHFFKKKK